jgi:hypothetical protein
MSDRFVNEAMNNTIEKVINKIYTSLLPSDKGIIRKYFVSFIEIMANIMGMNDKMYNNELLSLKDIIDTNRNAFYLDDNKMLRWLLQYILPYINEVNGKTRADINNLNDIYTEKVRNIDINKETPKYTYSNLQYGRCNRKNIKKIQEIEFSEKHIRDNYYLLIDSIRECCHKMHVNWKDILPFSLSNYENSQLFINTKLCIENDTIKVWDEREICNPDNFDFDKIHKYSKNLYIGTIYDTVSNLIYENILPVKWMLYNVNVDKNISGCCHDSLLRILGDIITLGPFKKMAKQYNPDVKCEKTYWSNASIDDKQMFKNDWNELVVAFRNKTQMYNNTSFTSFSTIVKSIIIGFNFGYSKIGLITRGNKKKSYIPLELKKLDNEIMENDEDIRFNEFPDHHFYKTLKSIQIEDMYDYFVESYSIYTQSVFYRIGTKVKEVLQNGKERTNENNPDLAGTIFTAKNFYNYCKSLVHYKDGNTFTRFPKHWKSLTPEQKEIFRNKLTDKNNTNEWFNIRRYIDVTFRGCLERKTDIYGGQRIIYLYCNNNLVKFVFEALIMSGTFTYYKPSSDPDIFNKSFEEKDDNPFWKGSYHYLTGTPNSLVPLSTYDDKNLGNEEISLFKYYRDSSYKWYTFISMHWISQIGLCHRIIQNRVHLITGGTGIGKSTIIPMLYLYYMKSIYYKLNCKVVCTFPRIEPTEKTAKSISNSMGLPIFDKYETNPGNPEKKGKYSNINHNVHIITGNKKHRNDNPGLKLVCTTDGSLLMSLANNPMLKNTGGTDKDDYTTRNTYEVVIVDEAHEHNANMDIILTLMRNVSYHNNSIATVIMSATIDEDEPTYRRFYRDINDNRKYPLDKHISLQDSEGNTIDRINCDRRLHIADPDSGTRYQIKEVYHTKETNPSDLAVKLITQSNGYLLMFQPGKKDIDENVELINAKTPKEVIALPYYATLGKVNGDDNGVSEYIKQIDNRLSEIKIAKDRDINLDGININKGVGNYNRCAIVATNIAEASITIDKLKVVIDTGKQKVNKFDRKTRTEVLGTEGITESSRLQRKGRVGRTQPGEVHYIYEHGAMSNNKIQFGISVQDITNNLLDLLQNDSNEKPFIDVDINVPETLTIDKLNNLTRGYGKVLKDLYYVNDEIYEYIGDNTQYDYDYHKICPMYYETGYRYMRVVDPEGQFYLIHPDELLLTRNINGEIIEVINKNKNDPDITLTKYPDRTNIIRSEKIIVFFENLMRLMLVTFDGNKCIKTEIGKYIKQITGKLEKEKIINDQKKTLLMLYGYVFGCIDQVIQFLSLNAEIDGDIKKGIFTYNTNTRRFNKKEIQQQISDKSSDILSLINLANIIDDYFKGHGYPLNHRDDKYISEYSQYVPYDIMTIIKQVIKNPEEYINAENIESIFENYLRYVDMTLRSVINDKAFALSKRIGVNTKLIVNYCKNVLGLRGVIDTLNIKDKRIGSFTLEELSSKLKPLTELVKTETLNDKITASLLLANPYNLVKNIDNTKNGYIDVFNPRLVSRKNCASLTRNTYIPACLMDDAYLKSYLYYDKYNTSTEEMTICHRVRPEFLSMLSHVIVPNEIKSYKDMSYDKTKYTNWNDVDIVTNYTRAYNQIISDLFKYHSNKIWKIIPKIDDKMKEYAEIMEKIESSPAKMIYGK